MKRVLAVLFTLCMSLTVSACQDQGGAVYTSNTHVGSGPESTVPSEPTMAESSDAQIENDMAEDDFLSNELLGLVGGPNSALDKMFSGECCAYNVGETTEALEYYDPYIAIFFTSEGAASFQPGVKPNDLLTYSSDPYADDLVVWSVYLKAEYDPALQTVTGQESLRRLFRTDKLITYDLISEELAQEPALETNPEATYRPIAKFNPFDFGAETAIDGGMYHSVYSADGCEIHVGFVLANDSYVALDANIQAMGSD